MSNTRSIFDIVGPTMIGPSSSHTAGAVRLGALARAIFGELPGKADIGLHGSFAATGEGHGTKLALIAGLLGMAPDDTRIPHSFSLAKEEGLSFCFTEIELEEAHPNTAVFNLSPRKNPDCPPSAESDAPGIVRPMMIRGSSIGGGNVIVTRIDDFSVHATGELPLLVVDHSDQPGVIYAVSGILTDAHINIAAMNVSREMRGARALMLIETDGRPDATTLRRILQQTQVHNVRYVPSV
ncbi:MAG: L-serine ammonia-lyase, iron-sulfur-dependent subunit beta [Coriobacteriia bacterium]|nr:L-serine ammonia-lyase, iron-sulfur-dependent subunit beta [Coriobacteriia bacterium]